MIRKVIQVASGKRRVTLSPCLSLSMAFLLCLFISKPLLAAEEVDTLVRGNQLYEQGDFHAAAQLYEQLVTQGIADSVLYYNLGNAYYKQGELGRAILNYERAARLAPRDADLRANLALARSQVADKYETQSTSPLGGTLVLVEQWLTLNELARLALLLWGLWAILWLGYRRLPPGRLRRVSQYALIVGALFVLSSVLTLGGILYRDSNRPLAIVLSSEIKVVSGPGAQYSTEFTLHSGAQVSLLETRGAWVRIALPGEQLQGWAPADTVAAVQRPAST